VSPRSAAAASEPHVAQAARDALARGNAADAVVAALLVAAAEHPAVLLGPAQILVGGGGAGLRAIDGRVRQPGSGVPRPRGLLPGEEVPPAARVGVPALPSALALALAAAGTQSLPRVARAAIDLALARSAPRAQVLDALSRRGPSAMAEESIAGELTAVAGRSAHGALSQPDLASVRPAIVSCDERNLEPEGVLCVPWRSEGRADASNTQVVAAADPRGLVAVACYETGAAGVEVPALGLRAPPFAAPVLRGEARVRPGAPRPAAAPIAIRLVRGVPDVGLGLATLPNAEASVLEVLAALKDTLAITAAFAAAPGGRPVAVVMPSA